MSTAGAGRRWTAAAGAWLGIGAAPATLTMGAAMADRNGGAVPIVALLVGGALMAALLYGQGLLGLRKPYGEDGTLTDLAPRYLPDRARTVITVLLGLAMIGWNGFNVGMGGASVAAVTGLPGPVGAVLLAVAVLAVTFASARAGNRIAVLTTLAALALVAVCVMRLSPPTVPVTAALGGVGPDVAVLVGYVAVFSLRAPDFSKGLSSRRDLAACVALLVLPACLIAVAGAGVWLRTGNPDVVATLASSGDLAAYGNLFVAAAVFAPALTTTYSGSLAVAAVFPRLPRAAAVLAVAVPGTLLAALRFDLYLLPWLSALAAALPPLVVPMAVEAWRRRRGNLPELVPTWTWAPAAAAATALSLAGVSSAPVLGLAAATVLTAAHVLIAGPNGSRRRRADLVESPWRHDRRAGSYPGGCAMRTAESEGQARPHLTASTPSDIRDLYTWIRKEPELRNATGLVESAPEEGALGPVADVIQVLVDAPEVVASLAGVIIAWLRYRTGKMTITLTRPDGQKLEISATSVKALNAKSTRELAQQIETALRLPSASSDQAPSERTDG